MPGAIDCRCEHSRVKIGMRIETAFRTLGRRGRAESYTVGTGLGPWPKSLCEFRVQTCHFPGT